MRTGATGGARVQHKRRHGARGVCGGGLDRGQRKYRFRVLLEDKIHQAGGL